MVVNRQFLYTNVNIHSPHDNEGLYPITVCQQLFFYSVNGLNIDRTMLLCILGVLRWLIVKRYISRVIQTSINVLSETWFRDGVDEQ